MEAEMSETTESGVQAPQAQSPDGSAPRRVIGDSSANSVQSPSGTTPNPIIDLITVLAEKADPLVKLVTAAVEKYQKGEERKARFQIHMAWVAVLVVLSIIAVASFLTYVGKIDGSTFTFLLGLIVGYVLTFIRDSIKSPES